MATAENVARYYLWLAQQTKDEPALITQMQLQKLVYLAQGWSLGVRGVPLFDERIEAWVHGPVIPSLRRAFGDFGHDPIPAGEEANDDALTAAERHHIHSTWDMYGIYSASHLRDLTHRQTPWRNARRGFPDDARSDAEITLADMTACFKEEYNRFLRSRGIDAASLELSSRQVREGKFFTLDLITGEISE